MFEINRIQLEKVDKLFFALGAVFVVLAIVLKLAELYAPTPVDAKFRQKFYKLFLSIGLSLVVWFAARYETVMFFGSHFVALVILLVGLVWFALLAAAFIRQYRKEKTGWEKEQVKLKYLPK